MVPDDLVPDDPAPSSRASTDARELDRLDAVRSIAVLFLLPDCDMSCRFCGGEEGFSTMSPAQAEDLLRALGTTSIRNVVFGGGEPFRWPHGLVRLTALARELGFLVQGSTGGASLPPGFEEIASIDRYILPLEAMDPDVHDRLRRYHGGHHRVVLEGIARLAESGKDLTVGTVVTRENLAHLEAIASFLEKLRTDGGAVHAWHLYRFLPVGRAGRHHADDLSVPREEYERVCRALQQRGLGFPVYRRLDMFRSRTIEYFWYEGEELRIGSRAVAKESPLRS